jgi:hypothetical protein
MSLDSGAAHGLGGDVGPEVDPSIEIEPSIAIAANRVRLVALGLAALFVAGVVGNAAIVLGLPYFVTVDGATHLGGSVALVDALLGRNALLGQFATLQVLPATNLIPEVPLGFLSEIIGPQWADKLVIAGYTVGFPLAVLYAVRGVDPRRWWLAIVALPLTFSFVLNYGLYNFCYGLIGFALVAGYVARHRERWTSRSVLTLAVLMTLTYGAHVLPFTQAALLLGVVTLWDWLRERPLSLRSLVRRSVPAAIAVAPGLLLMATLILGSPPGAGGTSLAPIAVFLGTLALAWGMVTYDLREIAFTSAVALALAALAAAALFGRVRDRRLRANDAFLLFGLLVIAEVAVVPGGVTLGAGGSYVTQRLQVIPVIGLIMWLADRDWRPRFAAGFGVTCMAAALGIMVLRFPAYSTLSADMESLVAVAPCMGTEATMIQANLGRVVPASLDRTDHFSDEAGRLSALTHGWPLGNVEFEIGFFPVHNRPDIDPYVHLIPDRAKTVPIWEPIQRVPPSIDLLGQETTTGTGVDYVLLFGRDLATPGTLADPAWLALRRQLETSYAHVATSPGRLLEVFERTGSSAAARGAARRATAGGCGL